MSYQQIRSEQIYQLINGDQKEIPLSVQDKLNDIGFFEKCLTHPIPIDLDQNDIENFLLFVKESDIEFDSTNKTHEQKLLLLFNSIFEEKQTEVQKVAENKLWPLIGFQNEKPSTDFRGGGFLSLEIILEFCLREKELVKDIMDFSNKYNNFLFACVCISAVFFLKKHLHIGVYSHYQKRLDYKFLCSAQVLKYFLTLNKEQGIEGLRKAFFQLAISHIKQIYFYWKLSYKRNRKLTIMDFKQVENLLREHIKICLETTAKREIMNETNQITLLKKELASFNLDHPITPNILIQLQWKFQKTLCNFF